MKKTFFVILLLMFVAVACDSRKDFDKEQKNPDTVCINIGVTTESTKAVIHDTGSGAATFCWEAGDDIGVVVDGALVRFALKEINDDGTAVFSANLPSGTTVQDNADIAFPYVPEDYSGGVFALSYPKEFTSESETSFRHRWAGKLNKDGEGNFNTSLHHQAGILRVTYSNVPDFADAITLTADKNLAGDSKTITINYSWHKDEDMSFYFPVPAGDYSSFTVSLQTAGETVIGSEKTLSGSTMTVNTGYIYRLPTIPFAGTKALVAVFSFTGTTKGYAEKISNLLGANLYEITPTEEYAADNNNYYDSSTRAYQEQFGPSSTRPAIAADLASATDYDVVYLGFPVWYGKVPRVVLSFLDTYDFSGKTVIPFISSDASGIDASETELHSTYSSINWETGQRLNSYTDEEIKTWLESYGMVTRTTEDLIRVNIGHTSYAATLARNATSDAFAGLLPISCNR